MVKLLWRIVHLALIIVVNVISLIDQPNQLLTYFDYTVFTYQFDKPRQVRHSVTFKLKLKVHRHSKLYISNLRTSFPSNCKEMENFMAGLKKNRSEFIQVR